MIAEPFTFFGNQTLVNDEPTLTDGVLFNGFPFVPSKVDVSGFDYWTTLGGTQKGNAATAEEIALSHDNAVKFYWNTYGLNYTRESDVGGDASGSINVVDDNSNQTALGPGEELPSVTPKDRDTVNEFRSQTANLTEGTGVAFGYPSTDFYVGLRSTASTTPIVKMYNGVTTGEANFVGFGVRSNYTSFLSGGAFPEPPDSGIFAPFTDSAGMFNYFVCQSYVDEVASTNASSYGYTDLPITGTADTLPFVCAIAYFGPATVTLSAADRLAIEASAPFDNKTIIDSIELYTYA